MSTPPPEPAAAAPPGTSPVSPTTPISRLPRVLSRVLFVALVASILSTLAFLGYLVGPTLTGGQPRAHFAALYAVGIGGLGVTEACQILGIVVLLAQWVARVDVRRTPRDLALLILALVFPPTSAILFLLTLMVYLRARWQDPTSLSTREAARAVRRQAVETLIDRGSDAAHDAAERAKEASASAATAVVHPGARPTLQDAVRRVVGPSTGQSVSASGNRLMAGTMVALVFSVVATLGVVVPAGGLAPLQASVGTPSTSTSAAPLAMVAGAWTLTASDAQDNIANCQQGCSQPTTSGALIPDTGFVTVAVQQSGGHVTMTFPAPPAGTVSTSGPVTLTGTISGGTLSLSWSSTTPGESFLLTGSVLSADRMGGTFTYTGGPPGPDFTHAGDWSGTKVASASPTATA